MKHTVKLRWILGLTLVTAFVSTITASLTWFDNRINWKPSITGSSAAAYFAYGDGSEAHPYGIKTPRHLYNLAWLQYLGQFNGTDKAHVYFELASDVDMSDNTMIGAIPPIGTATNPFVGVFKGNGHIIKHLKISNNYEEFLSTPYSVTSASYNTQNQNILGMFGVVGDSSQDYNPDVSVSNFYLDNPEIKSTKEKALAGVVAGYVNANVSSIGVISPKMSFSTSSTSSLGTDSGLNGKTFNTVSDYSLVGYCEDNYKSKISSSITKMTKSSTNTLMVPPGDTSSGSGDDHGWGGSIDMYSLYNRLSDQKSQSSVIEYVTEVKMDSSSNQVASTTAPVKINSWQNKEMYTDFVYPKYDSSHDIGNEYFGFRKYPKASQGLTTTSIAFVDSPNDIDKNSIELTGAADRYIKDGKTIDFTSVPNASKKEKRISLFYEKKGDTNIYLKVSLTGDGTVMETTEKPAEASLIYLSKDTTNNTYTISTILNGKEYFLNAKLDKKNTVVPGVRFEPSSTPTTWFYSKDSTAFCLSSNPHLFFSLDTNFKNWGIRSEGVSYHFDSGSYNFSVGNSSSSFVSATGNDITEWFLYDKKIYLIEKNANENKARYLVLSGGNLKISNSPTNSFGYLEDSDGIYIYCVKEEKLYYPVYSNNSWSVESESLNAENPTEDEIREKMKAKTKFTLTKIGNSIPFLFGGQDGSETSMVTDSEFETPDTYIPLQVDSTTYDTLDKNTGYLVGGTDYYEDYAGDIRVSKYDQTDDKRNISNSFNQDSKTLTAVYTINPDGTTVDSKGNKSTFSSFSKYNSAKEQMETVLKNDTGLYGLHFMNGEIGKRRDGTYVSIPSAKINGVTHSDYQVPDDCIDFSLKDEGIINFFGGTYYDANNCFFSLYKVERNADKTISSLKKIKAIYSADEGIYWPETTTSTKKVNINTDPSYFFTDSNESKIKIQFEGEENVPKWNVKGPNPRDTSKTTNLECEGEKVFDIDNQLGRQNNFITNAVYYFEIPVPAGEYALGSVNDSLAKGAYLMYLDLGINAKVERTVNRTIISEYMTHSLNTYTTFLGVNIVTAGKSDKNNFNSYCITIKDGATGKVTFSMNADSKSGLVETSAPITGTDSTVSWLTLKFKKDDCSLKGEFNGINGTIQNDDEYDKTVTTVTETKRVTYYDYDSVKETTNTMEVTSTSTKPGEWNTLVSYYTKTGTDIFEPTKELKFARSETTSTPFTREEIETLAVNSTYDEDELYSFEMESKELGKITVSFKSKVQLESDGYYQINAYDFTISGEGLLDQTTVSVTSIKKNNDGTSTYTLRINKNDVTNLTSIEVTIGSSANQ